MLRTVTRKLFSMGESRVARHIRPPRNISPLKLKMERYQVETMKISKAVGSHDLMDENTNYQRYSDKNSDNWKQINVQMETTGKAKF